MTAQLYPPPSLFCHSSWFKEFKAFAQIVTSVFFLLIKEHISSYGTLFTHNLTSFISLDELLGHSSSHLSWNAINRISSLPIFRHLKLQSFSLSLLKHLSFYQVSSEEDFKKGIATKRGPTRSVLIPNIFGDIRDTILIHHTLLCSLNHHEPSKLVDHNLFNSLILM